MKKKRVWFFSNKCKYYKVVYLKRRSRVKKRKLLSLILYIFIRIFVLCYAFLHSKYIEMNIVIKIIIIFWKLKKKKNKKLKIHFYLNNYEQILRWLLILPCYLCCVFILSIKYWLIYKQLLYRAKRTTYYKRINKYKYKYAYLSMVNRTYSI